MTVGTSPICVQDTFHFSHYYWREIEGQNSNEASDDDSTTPTMKPKPVQKDTIKLKFYAQGTFDDVSYVVVVHHQVDTWDFTIQSS